MLASQATTTIFSIKQVLAPGLKIDRGGGGHIYTTPQQFLHSRRIQGGKVISQLCGENVLKVLIHSYFILQYFILIHSYILPLLKI